MGSFHEGQMPMNGILKQWNRRNFSRFEVFISIAAIFHITMRRPEQICEHKSEYYSQEADFERLWWPWAGCCPFLCWSGNEPAVNASSRDPSKWDQFEAHLCKFQNLCYLNLFFFFDQNLNVCLHSQPQIIVMSHFWKQVWLGWSKERKLESSKRRFTALTNKALLAFICL